MPFFSNVLPLLYVQLTDMAKKVKLKVLGLTASQIHAGAYALILAEENGTCRIPIIVGTAEAQAIAISLEHITPPRPLTHDLFVTFTHSFGILLQEVFIYRFNDGIFYAEMVLFDGERQVRLDSRTSDAIAIALRLRADIYTTDEILTECGLFLEEADKNGDSADEDDDDLLNGFYYDEDEDEFEDDEDDEDEEDEDDEEYFDDRISPSSFKSEKRLREWLETLSVPYLRKRMQQAIETEDYEHAKIYKDELKRRGED